MRYVSIAVGGLILLLALISNTALAINQYQDIFVTLSARPLGMGGAAAAVPQPASVFYNPACLAALRRFSVMWNHNMRHFGYTNKGGKYERDQLDGDTEAIVVPLPLSTYAHGWTASGEYGYDYRNHPADGSLGYPRDHYWGTEEYDALAGSFGLPIALGISQRRSMHVFEPDAAGFEPAWTRLGEGNQLGIYARVLPGLEYGQSTLKHDFDWHADNALSIRKGETAKRPDWPRSGLEFFSSRIKTKRSGFAFHPTGWLTMASDDVSESYIFRDPQLAYGTIQTGDKTIHRTHLGGELHLGSLATYRWGLYDGRPTVGATLDVLGLNLNYAECKDLLPEIIGSGDKWKDVHIYGADTSLY